MDASTFQLKDRIGYRDLKDASEVSDVYEVNRAPAIATIAGRDRNLAPDGLHSFDLDNELSL